MRLKTTREFVLDAPGPAPEVNPVLDAAPPQALSLIDEALAGYVSRSLVASTEVVDLLLDLRSTIVVDTRLAALMGAADRP